MGFNTSTDILSRDIVKLTIKGLNHLKTPVFHKGDTIEMRVHAVNSRNVGHI
jgi:hypothetical protein